MNRPSRLPCSVVVLSSVVLGLSVSSAVGEETIKIGVLHSKTGTMAISELSLIDAAKLAIEEINQSGGVLGRRIKIIERDGRSDPQVFAAEARRLIEDEHVCAVFGIWTSKHRKAALPVFKEYDHLLWYPVQYEGGESFPYCIYTGASPNQQLIPAVDWCLARHGKRVFLVGSDYDFPRDANKIIRAYLDRNGATCVGEEYRDLGDKDFKQIVAKIKAARPDVIFNTVNGDSNVGLFFELNAAGIGPKECPVMSVSIAEDELRSMGTYLTKGHYCAWNYFQSVDTIDNRRFVERFKNRFGMGRVTDDPIEAAYFQIHLFAKAVARAGSVDTKAIRKAAKGLTFAAPGGLVHIDATNQHTWKAARIGQIQEDGQFKIVWDSKKPIRPIPFLKLVFKDGEEVPAHRENVLGAVPPEAAKAVPVLLAALKSKDVEARQEAATALGVLGPEAHEAASALGEALKGDDWLLQQYAAGALGRIGPDAVAVLVNALKENDPQVRALAARALGEIGPDAHKAASALINALKSDDAEVRQEAARALGNIGTAARKAIPALIGALDDKETTVCILAVEALGKMKNEAKAALPALTKALGHSYPDVRSRSARVVVGIARELQETDTDALRNLEKAHQTLSAGDFDKEDVEAVHREIKNLKAIQDRDVLNRLFRTASENKWVVLIGVAIAAWVIVYLFVWLVGLRLFPLWLLRVNTSLQPYTEIKLDWFGLKLNLLGVLVIGMFHFHRRVLDAWVAQYINDARANFHGNETVNAREIYIPLPVDLNDKSQSGASARSFDATTSRPRWCVLLWGEGGSGKTALACQMANWAMGPDPKARLCKSHHMLPVLIEPGQGQQVIKDIATLKTTINGQLRALINSHEDIPEALFEHLLRKQRILVLIDDIAELADPDWSLPNHKDFPVSALIVTSRSKEKLGNVPLTTVRPLGIPEARHLSTFMHEYLTQKGQRQAFSDPEFFTACERLSAMGGKSQAGERKMTVLFAKMYADQLISLREGGGLAYFPRGIPDLILGYLNEINRNRRDTDPEDAVVHGAAKLAAWECLRKTYRPGIVKRQELAGALDKLGGLAMLTYLEKRLRLIRIVGPSHDEIRFTLDPLAEYLAGLHLVAAYGSDDESWRKFLRHADDLQVPPAETRGFLLAVRDCCLGRSRSERVPDYLLKELASRAGLASEAGAVGAIKIGVLHSLTGTMAISERSLVDAARLAIDEINQAGGIQGRKIVAITEDGASDKATFAQKARKLITEDEVCSVFGCWTSASRKEVLPIFEKYENLLWYPVQYEGGESSPNIIYTGAAPNQQILPAVDYCLEHLGNKLFLVGSDYLFPREANRLIKKYLAMRGATWVGEEYRDLGDKDFKEIIRKIKETQPQVIFNTVNGDSNVGLFYELNAAGITLPVMSVSIAEDEVRSIGTGLTAGHYCAWNYFQSVDTPANRRFVEAFKKSYGMERVTDDPIEAAYFQVHLFARAVAKAGSIEPRAIRSAAGGLAFAAPGGEVQIDAQNQHTCKIARIGKIQEDGQFEIVWDSHKPIRPEPYPQLDATDGQPAAQK